ncbi:metal cation symporter ZIP14-like isoform X1 [Montipora capricornis]|uniref:metal cation symporter ZIP14-like isoform X1 n=1 Tax=Montipora capricornis TaxID=246305 RepID=UPI0035F17225
MYRTNACKILAHLWIFVLFSATDSHVLSHAGVRSVSGPSARSFVDSLFEEYGANKSMNLNQFDALLKELKIGKPYAGEGDRSSGIARMQNGVTNGDSKCYQAKTLFESFSVDASGLNPRTFERICPALVEQIESKACLLEKPDNIEESGKQSKAHAWGFGFVAVTLISCASLLGAFVVPFMNQSFYKMLLLFMVSLAVGVLSGSGVFHLIPHTFGFGQDGETSYLWKCLVIIGGIYLFFFLEYTMKMFVRFRQKSSCENHQDLEKSKGSDIAEVQLQLYNVNQDTHHNHHNVCLTEDVPPVQIKLEKSTGKRKVAPVAWMIIIGDGLHNFIDGLAIGASFSTSTFDGVSTSLAIFCEELPHELGDFAVLLNAGMSYKAAMGFNFLSACACYVGLIIGLLLGYTTSAVKWIYALAGGMFIYIALVDMLEEACEMSVKIGKGSLRKNLKTFALQNGGMLLGIAIMFVLALYGGEIKVK